MNVNIKNYDYCKDDPVVLIIAKDMKCSNFEASFLWQKIKGFLLVQKIKEDKCLRDI